MPRKATANDAAKKQVDRSAAAKVMRDAKICSMRAKRKPFSVIAEEVGLSVRQCEKVWHQYLADRSRGIVAQGPDSVVAEAIEEIEMLADKMAQIGEQAEGQKDGNLSVVIGAAKVQEKLLMDKISLMQATGLLPHDLGTIRHLHDVRLMVTEIVSILRERKVPLAVQREIQQVVAAV